MDSGNRHQLFESARTLAGWSVQQLWVAYLAVGGTRDAFEIEAYLAGLAPLSGAEQDVLASALNERLYERAHAAQVPYLNVSPAGSDRATDPLAVLEELLSHARTVGQQHTDEPDEPDERGGR